MGKILLFLARDVAWRGKQTGELFAWLVVVFEKKDGARGVTSRAAVEGTWAAVGGRGRRCAVRVLWFFGAIEGSYLLFEVFGAELFQERFKFLSKFALAHGRASLWMVSLFSLRALRRGEGSSGLHCLPDQKVLLQEKERAVSFLAGSGLGCWVGRNVLEGPTVFGGGGAIFRDRSTVVSSGAAWMVGFLGAVHGGDLLFQLLCRQLFEETFKAITNFFFGHGLSFLSEGENKQYNNKLAHPWRGCWGRESEGTTITHRPAVFGDGSTIIDLRLAVRVVGFFGAVDGGDFGFQFLNV